MNVALTDEETIRVYFPNQPSQCFEILYQRYHLKIYQQCLAITCCHNQARDYTQDMFIKVFQKLGTFQQRSRFTTARRPGWLHAIAHNYCQDQRRLSERFSTTMINNYLEMTLADKTETLSEQEVVRRFSLAMNSLSDAEQTILRLKYEQQWSLKEIATQFGLSLSAVKMSLKRSRVKMQRCYAKQLPN